MIVILGGGISGISAGFHLDQEGKENVVYEKNKTWGGLCDNFTIGNGFRFDNFVHFSFAKNKHVRDLFSKASEHIAHKPVSSNFYKGYWLKHPVQNNLALLPVKKKIKILEDFINKSFNKNPAKIISGIIMTIGDSCMFL